MSLCGLWPSHPLLVFPLSLPQIEKLKAELSQLKASNTTQTAEALAGRDQKDVVRECSQEYIRDRSMQSRVLTCNSIFLK